MDRLDAMRLFLRVVERGSFSAAAREFGLGQSAASKQVAALEARLGSPLLLRSSRRLRLTEPGRGFYDAAVRLIADYDDMEAEMGRRRSAPTGHLRVALAPVFGRLYVVPLLPAFLARFPGISVETFASDRPIDLIAEGIDLALRHGDMPDSSLAVRRLMDCPLVTVATPAYLARRGRPQAPADLARHACIAFTGGGEIRPWRFRGRDGAAVLHRPDGGFRSSDGEQIRAAVLADLGLARLPAWIVLPDLVSGALVTVLEDAGTEALPISAVYPSRRGLTTKVRLFLEALALGLDRDLRGPLEAVLAADRRPAPPEPG